MLCYCLILFNLMGFHCHQQRPWMTLCSQQFIDVQVLGMRCSSSYSRSWSPHAETRLILCPKSPLSGSLCVALELSGRAVPLRQVSLGSAFPSTRELHPMDKMCKAMQELNEGRNRGRLLQEGRNGVRDFMEMLVSEAGCCRECLHTGWCYRKRRFLPGVAECKVHSIDFAAGLSIVSTAKSRLLMSVVHDPWPGLE